MPVFLVDSSCEWNKSQAEIHPLQLPVTLSSTQPAAAQLLHQWISLNTVVLVTLASGSTC